MSNIAYEVAGDKLIITVDISQGTLAKSPLSSTGKSRLVASGSEKVRDGLKFSLNVMTPA